MSDTMKEYIAEAEKDLLHTYNRYQIVLDKGDGVYLYNHRIQISCNTKEHSRIGMLFIICGRYLSTGSRHR